MSKKLDILTIGAIKLDTFILIPEAAVHCQLKMPQCQLCIEYGKKNQVDDIELQIAGSAPNVAVGISRMKKTSAVYSQMGDDIIYSIAMDFLKQNNVNTKFVKAVKGVDSSYAAILNYKGESTQLVAHNKGEYLLPDKHPHARWVHVSELGKGYQKLYKELSNCCAAQGIKVSFNPGTVQLKERRRELFKLLKSTTVLFLNKVEAESLLQIEEKTEMHNMMASLKALGPEYVVVTDGRNGAYAFDGKQLDYAPMFPGKRVEATGAGDAFATGFLGALMHNKKHDEALKWGSVNAASVVNSIGPTKGLLTHTEIRKRLKEKPNYKTKEL